MLDPLSQQAVAERILVLVTPEPRSQRLLRRALRSGAAARLRDRRALGAPARAASSSEEEAVSLAALRRLASILGAHFLEVEGDDLSATVKRVVARARLDLRLRRHARRVAPDARSCAARSSRSSSASCPGSTSASSPTARCARRSSDDGRARRGCSSRSPRRSRPSRVRSGAGRASTAATRVARILVPFTGGALDPTVLAAAIRIARAEDATLVPAYLIVVPLELAEDAPMQQQVTVGDAAARGGRARRAARRACRSTRAIESGRTPIHALQRLWEAEHFDRIVVPAPIGRSPGFAAKDLTWMLTHAPSETLILRPDPARNGAAAALRAGANGPPGRASYFSGSTVSLTNSRLADACFRVRAKRAAGGSSWQTSTPSRPTPELLTKLEEALFEIRRVIAGPGGDARAACSCACSPAATS